MTLNEIERDSVLWKKIKAYLSERLDVARKKNDGNLDATETARIRGMISAYKDFLALEQAPEIVADEQ